MKKLALLFLAGFAGWWAYYRYGNPAVVTSLKFPSRCAWRCVTSRANERGVVTPWKIEVIIVDGEKWRIEARHPGATRLFVAVWDGHSFGSLPTGYSVETLNPIGLHQRLFEGLKNADYVGQELMDGRHCWRFHAKREGREVDVWIDRDTRFLTKVSDQDQDGKRSDHRYQMIPLNLDKNAYRLFDTRALNPIFLTDLTRI
jgi:hypothetical protein